MPRNFLKNAFSTQNVLSILNKDKKTKISKIFTTFYLPTILKDFFSENLILGTLGTYSQSILKFIKFRIFVE